MKGYGQFCAIARALELLGERWTLLIVRELLCGSRRFGDLRRGVPRISRTMLSARLRQLEDAGVVTRSDADYELTAAGLELDDVIRSLGVWGQTWLSREVTADQLDIDALLWDVRRRVKRESLPVEAVLVRFELTDAPATERDRYLLLRRAEVSLCARHPGHTEELVVRADRATLIGWWRGDFDLRGARRRGLRIEGKRARVRAFESWFERYLFADVPPSALRPTG